MDWTDHAIFWHVYPLGFCGAPIRPEPTDSHPPIAHRLRRLTGYLDYVRELGACGLLLGPIFAASTHGYDTIDAFRIDPRLGDDDDFAQLVDGCASRGLRLVLDGVFSHVSSRHPQLRQVLHRGPGDPAAPLFDIDWETRQVRVFEGHGDLARLNHASQLTKDYVTEVLNYWLERGIDGWRLDAAYAVDPAFWASVLPQVRTRYRHAYFLAEVIHGDYAAFTAASGVDSVTQYQLWKAIWSSLVDRNFFELDWALQRHNEFLETFVPNTFIGNHDVTRIASTVGDVGAVVALAVLLTVGGIPSIYAGDEQGLTGIKLSQLGGDDQIRPTFPDRPSQLAGHMLVRTHQELIGLRRRHPWLVRARTHAVELTNTRYRYRSLDPVGGDYLDITVHCDGAVQIAGADGTELWHRQAPQA